MKTKFMLTALLMLFMFTQSYSQVVRFIDTTKAGSGSEAIVPVSQANPFPVKVLNTSSSLPTGTDFTDGTEGFAPAIDTLSGASDTVTFNFGNQFKTCAVILKDTSGGSGLIDSVKIETYNSALDTWGTKIVGLYETGTGDIWTGDIIVPGNATTKKYYLNDQYPSQVRISWVFGADKTGRIMPISFEGGN